MKKTLMLLLSALLFVAVCSAESFTSVSMAKGLQMMKSDEGSILVDVRRPDEYAAGHIPGAIQLTNEEMTREGTLAVLPDSTQHIYVYCRSGRRSLEAARKLASWGYTHVIEIGGILSYTGEIEK